MNAHYANLNLYSSSLIGKKSDVKQKICQFDVAVSQNLHKALIFQCLDKSSCSERFSIIFQHICPGKPFPQNNVSAGILYWHILTACDIVFTGMRE
jgi:hypothetical protein